MWIKYNGKRINLNNLTYFTNYDYGIEYWCNGSDGASWLNFENKNQQDKALELIDKFIKGNYVITVE